MYSEWHSFASGKIGAEKVVKGWMRRTLVSSNPLGSNALGMALFLHLALGSLGSTMTLKIRRICEKHGTRICLSGELRCAHLVDLRAELEEVAKPVTLDLDEVAVVDIDGVRLLNECRTQGIQVVNCSPYIREWMLQEERAHRDDK